MKIPKQVLILISQHDPLTFLHIKRVSQWMESFSFHLNLSHEEVLIAKYGGLLHDIGKLEVDCELLHKPNRLSGLEFEEIKKHSNLGYDILHYYDIDQRILEMTKWHHERWDGKGYPDQMDGKDLPLLCRMLSIVDAWEAMTGKRAYRNSLQPEDAIKELIKGKDTQFDPVLVDSFVTMHTIDKERGEYYYAKNQAF